jgi:hypothetical protein
MGNWDPNEENDRLMRNEINPYRKELWIDQIEQQRKIWSNSQRRQILFQKPSFGEFGSVYRLLDGIFVQFVILRE